MPPEHAGWWNDLSFNLQGSEQIDQAVAALSNAACNLGFTYCSFGYRDRPPFNAGNIVVMSSYPDAWRARYREQRYLEIDPVAQLDATNPAPVVWSDDLFMDAQLLWDEARAAGLKVGISQPCWDPRGRCGVFSLSRDRDALKQSEVDALRPYLAALGHLSMTYINKLADRERHDTAGANLTRREIEILRWTADGGSAKSISNALDISADTVNFHLKNCMRKLNAPSKVAAAAYAIAYGYL
ncbi:autoinducer binding domain-containing protein [Paraburkholderia sp. D15]|uniref:autoinducer binding domain-containing protein n=1 Tax=Paraburkholderia sp. D15 TaxID=2880218 RepID=UPI00247B292B|nr:autoinducer binding domain-containing protein [Paraburkholderia sp. D15]WGS53460.1 autoinducer binding domain-containing protein [Paraburkholderia sp. D15]